ncbi:MAG: hypothetical protein QM652_11340 [Legionella sp.]|uniref:capsular polysaccharide export protein, LipB/KpsS family n=1 Tax=Legionella sp. TaxID=459 RepID=UPI0039E5525B
MNIFSPDSVHINNKNFGSLFSFIHGKKWHYDQHTRINHLIAKYGNYKECPPEIYNDFIVLNQFDKDMLWSARVQGINLFQLVKLELLSYLAKDDDLSRLGKVLESRDVFEYAYLNERDVLIKNLAVGAFFIKYWSNFLSKSKKYDFAFIFSGCLTYSRSLIELLKKTSTRVFILESFFTGNEYYIEERFSPLPNNSLLANSNYYNSIKIDMDSYIKDRAKAINKYLLADNLNVKQPEAQQNLPFKKGEYILILGQVVNDFSLLNYRNSSISSLAIYVEFIEKILDSTDIKIIFKAHPWENKKANLNSPVTSSYIKGHFSAFLEGRLAVIEDFNLQELLNGAYCVVTINSQAGIEAAYHGIKPIVLGNAFYGNKGFTHDINCENIDECVRLIKNSSAIDFTLTLSEYEFLEKFLVKSLMYSLVSKHKSGLLQLRQFIAPFNNSISLVKVHHKKIPANSHVNNGTENFETLLKNAKNALTQSHLDEALHIFVKAEKLAPDNMNIKRQKAEIFLKKGNRKDCLLLLKDVRKVIPHNKNLRRRYLVIKYPMLKLFYGNSPFVL